MTLLRNRDGDPYPTPTFFPEDNKADPSLPIKRLGQALQRLIVYCLKQGKRSDRALSFSSLSIRTVRKLLTAALRTELVGAGRAWYEETVFLPHQVHAMVLVHSNYRAFVFGGCDGGVVMRLGVEVMVMV